ncbi:VWA domain-containing protein [Rhodocytophaga aerolata]|uniref:VWA domain-containing protein n=1 Tax=Rhodocytophaga aerolata TaxID=455078 RepID=A0ABT8R2N0_9BACT|nr:VWA domain-containing protein [Rhodocytophaga aerolata]MDO1446371.1 VWA domain-containing protein [Rhodocytophaga aerolata]
MNWYYALSIWEYVFISLFGVLYLAYAVKITIAARKFQNHARAIFGKFLLRSLYFGLLIIALMGPSYGSVQKEVKAIGKDIYLLVDLSESMNADDLVPSRLDRVKLELNKLVDNLQTDRIGLIIFSTEAFVQCPLTFDKNTLKLFIETLSTTIVPSGGTNLEPALRMAMEKHTSNVTSENNAKIIVLVSDGEHHGENLSRISREIDKSGIRLFALGVGTAEGGKIPSGRGYKKDKSGGEIVTRLADETLFTTVSQLSDRYFVINDSQNEIYRLIQAIDSIEGRFIDQRKTDATANKYDYFLIAALLLLSLDVLITVKTIQL